MLQICAGNQKFNRFYMLSFMRLFVMMAMSKLKWTLIILISLILIQSYCLPTVQGASDNASTDEWTMYRHDPSHSGHVSNNESPDSAKLLWTCTTGRGVQSSPAVANGYLFVGCRDSQVWCINASTGIPIWKIPFHYEVWSSPAIDNEHVYVGTDDGYLYCLNITTGTPIWRTPVGGPVRSSPALEDGCIFIGSGGHDVYCLNASDGAIIWNFPTLNRANSSPAVSEGVVYVATDDFFVYAINATTGKEIWRTHTGSVRSSPSVYNGYIYIGSIDGYVYGLNASTGKKIWQFQVEDEVNSSPAVAYGCVYIGAEDNNVYCLNASDGKKIWQSPTGYWVTSSPAVADGNVYVGSEDHSIYCFDAFTGAKKWSYETGNFVESSPTVVNGTLYVGSDDYNIYAFTLCDSTVGNLPLQDTNALNWTTVAFDVIAFAILAGIICAIALVVRNNRRDERKAETINVPSQKQSWFSKHIDAVCILAILAFSIIFFINLGSGPLWGADEQTYSQWAFHMTRTGDYFTPWAFSEMTFWIAKPPLYMWLMSLSYQALGVSNFSSRLWSPIFGMLSLVVVFYLGKTLYNRRVGFLAALVLGTFTTFFSFARHAMTDVAFVFFIVSSIYFLVLSQKHAKVNRYAALSGLFFGLALMTKQIQAFLLPLVIVVYLVLTQKSLRFLITKRFALFLGVGFLVFAPWLIYMMLRFGSPFYEWYFMYSGFTRTVSPIEGHYGNYLFYFNYLISSENPLWTMLLPLSAGLCAFYAAVKRSKADSLILVWASIVLGLFTFAQTKLYWYILPAFPAFALAISSFIYQLSKKIQQRRNSRKKVDF
jgi:outer membrane protein assembly factor BamB